MKSFFEQYKKHTLKKQVQVLIPAFILALGFNYVLFTEWGHRLQGSIVNYDEVVGSDLSVIIDPENGTWSIRVHQDLEHVESIHVTLLYDEATVVVSDLIASSWELLQITDTVPLNMSIVFSQPTDISTNQDILGFSFLSLASDPRTINVSDVFFLSGGERFEMKSQGSGPF